jgi:hypothetical protein
MARLFGLFAAAVCLGMLGDQSPKIGKFLAGPAPNRRSNLRWKPIGGSNGSPIYTLGAFVDPNVLSFPAGVPIVIPARPSITP